VEWATELARGFRPRFSIDPQTQQPVLTLDAPARLDVGVADDLDVDVVAAPEPGEQLIRLERRPRA